MDAQVEEGDEEAVEGEATNDQVAEGENQDGEDGNKVTGQDEAAGASSNKRTKADIDNIWYVLINCSVVQKVNFLMIFFVYAAQILKYVFDTYANS